MIDRMLHDIQLKFESHAASGAATEIKIHIWPKHMGWS